LRQFSFCGEFLPVSFAVSAVRRVNSGPLARKRFERRVVPEFFWYDI
jgi:hypothetical protein